jgi:hypothetical protein
MVPSPPAPVSVPPGVDVGARADILVETTQASGLMASPTEPNGRMLESSLLEGTPFGNQVMKVKDRVGAV